MIGKMHGETQSKQPVESRESLPEKIRQWAVELGFDSIGIARASVPAAHTEALTRWLAAGQHGTMDYMARHAALRASPQTMLPGALSVISVAMNYWPRASDAVAQLTIPTSAYVSRYALGRDYHKLIRPRLQRLIDRLGEEPADVPGFSCRACTDSAPVMEVEFARQAGLGWRGKHTLLLQKTGSWRFIGEILTTLDLPPSQEVSDHCGRCTRCLDVCPTKAITAPYVVDARRCISYLTIEHAGPIPEALRPLLGNRVYGCDDCQLFCPWNRFAAHTKEADFAPRGQLDQATLAELFLPSETAFNDRFSGSPIRRIGHARWLRNLAVALGNAPTTHTTLACLASRQNDPSELVREHVAWALAQHQQREKDGIRFHQTVPTAVATDATQADRPPSG
jgi:epoxyqueuosine reductase